MSGISSGVADQLKLQLPSWLNMMQLIGFSKDFFELVRDIGEAKSKEEEERIIKNEAQKLKISMSQPDQSRHKMKEYLIRTMYCVMLGHDIPFAYVHALTMTQDPKIYNKRTGYLAVSLCLHENHELLLMVVNSIQKGLLSTNYLEVSSALIALCKLINQDTIPAFLPTVVNLLAHPKAVVRKKACMAVHRFWLKSPESISHLADKLRVVLCDRDPSVMAASLCLFLDMARVDTAPFKDLIPSFVSILKQVSENRLPRSYEYHGVPAPWIQINLLKLLALLGEGDQTASEHMYEVLLQSLQRAEKHKNNAGYAVLFEAIMSITRIRANNPLLEAAANSIGQLIRVRNHNLKYLGIQALAAIVRVAPRFVAPHQMEVIECLESTDESIKRKTLDLLYRMTNTKNVVVIVAKLIEYLQNTVATDELVRAELVSRINELAERYAPNNHWYIDTMNIMLQLGGTLVRPEVAYNLIRLISQGSGNSEEEDMQLRHYAVTTFLKSLESGDTLPDIQVQVLAWVVSEYGYLATDDGSGVTLLGIVTRFADLMERPHTDVTTRGWILTGLLKLAAQLDQIPPSIITLTQKYTRSRHPDLMMRAYEFLALVHNPVLMGEVLPVDASCEDLEVDPKLSFLNAYASRGVATGVFKPYIPREARQPLSASLSSPSIPIASSSAYTSSKKELNFSYPAPPPPSNTVSITGTISHQTAVPSPITSQPSSAPNTPPPSRAELPLSPEAPISTLQQLKVPNAGWTREGFQGKTTTTTPVSVQPQAASTPAPATVPSTAMYNKPASSAPPKGPTTPKMNEKQASLANQLFSGLSLGDSATSNYAPAANSYAPSAKTAPKPRNPPQTKPTSAPSTPTITPTTPPATRNNIPNISKTASTSSMPTSLGFTPSQPPTPTTSSSDFLIDLADLGSAFSSSGSLKSSTPLNTSAPLKTSTPSPLPTSPISSPINPHRSSEIPSLMDDVIISNQPTIPSYGSSDNVLAPSAPLASQITPGNFDVSNLSYTPFLGSIFDGSPSTPAESVGKPDENLHVGCAKVMRADETLLVFLLGNKSTQTLTDVVTSIKVPEHFSVELAADPVVQVSGHTFTLSTLPPGKAALQAVRLKHKKLGFNMAVIAQVQYSCEGRRTNIADCNVHVEISDLLRPHVITIDQVGKVWHTYNQETKTKITPSKVETSKALLERLASEMGVHIVQVIGNEGIAAGRLVSGAGQVSGSVLLMHVQVGPQPVGGQAVDVTVRTKDKSFTEVVVRHIHKIIR